MEPLIRQPEIAGVLGDYLGQKADEGHRFVVYNADKPIDSPWDLHCFQDGIEAFSFAREYQQLFNWHEAVPIGELSAALEKINYSLIQKDMNRNSLEDFKEHVKNLKIPAEMAKDAEDAMEKNLQYIQVTAQLPSRRGFMEATLHLKRSEQSDYYFLNKYDLAYSKAKPLENKYQYVVRTQVADGVKQEPNLFRRFDSPISAIEYFKSQNGTSELLTAKEDEKLADGKRMMIEGQSLATMKDGKIDYVTKDFQPTFNNDPLKNTIYINQGKGFNMSQSANMLMGGSAYREDLVSRAGKQYSAWNEYQFDQPRDRYGNLPIRQYGEGYPFNLNSELSNYKIKELDDPKKLEQMVAQMKDGERPVVTVANDKGEEMKMMAKAMPRYGNINFYDLDGKLQKREQFLKEPKQELGKDNSLSKNQNQRKSQDQGITL